MVRELENRNKGFLKMKI